MNRLAIWLPLLWSCTPTASPSPMADISTPDMIILHGGEQAGNAGTCGCVNAPLGGLDRVDGVRVAMNAPTVLVNPGGWLDDTIGLDGLLRADVVMANDFMLRGLQLGEWTALNLTYRDLPYVAEHGIPANAISANLKGPGVIPAVDVPSLNLSITGVTKDGRSFLQPDGYSVVDPLEALREVVPGLKSDLVIVLAYELPDKIDQIAAIEGVDMVIEADSYKERWPIQSTTSGWWARSPWQTRRLGLIRTQIRDGRFEAARDEAITLNEDASTTPELKRLVADAEQEVQRMRDRLSGLP